MMSQQKVSRQSGFTLIELLIAVALTLLIVVAVQRYVAGVTTDQSHLSAQQDQTSQMNISLSNIQNDVARAGFVPLASAKEFALIDEPVQIRACSTTTPGSCQNKTELVISYWAWGDGVVVHDCVGHTVDNRTGKWAKVENIYRVKTNGELACSGNGGDNNYTFSMLNGVASFAWRLGEPNAQTGARILSLCVTTRLDVSTSIVGSGTAKNCVNGDPWGASAGTSPIQYQTTQLDMLVRPHTMDLSPIMQAEPL